MSDQITESQDTFEVTQGIIDSTAIDGVWVYTENGKSHPAVRRRDNWFSLCGIRMDERSSECALPALATCRFCLKLLPSTLAQPVQDELPDLQVTPDIPVIPTTSEDDRLALPRITQVMVNEGLFLGVAAIREDGPRHAVVVNESHFTAQATQCGVTVGSGRKGHKVTWQELPAVVDCGSCLPHTRGSLASPSGPGETIARLAEKLRSAIEARDRVSDVNRQIGAELRAVQASMEEGLTGWRKKQRSMGGRIGYLEGREQELLHRIEILEENGKSTPDEVRAENQRLRVTLARWRGIAAVLAWKYGGIGLSEKKVALDPMEWAAAYGELFLVNGDPLSDDGSFEMKVTIRKPGDLGVPSENDGGREA